MAHRNNQSRTPRTSHHLQDDRLFSLSGGIPPEHFDDLNFVSTRRGMTERVPLTEPICLTAEDLQIRCTVCNTIDCMIHNPRHLYCMDCGQRLLGPHVCSNRIERTTVAIPHNTTKAMDTDEGQRTTARLLEEAHRLSTAAREPTYASIDETLSATLQGSEAAISDILSTPDPREIHKLETGEKSPTPVEMKASLPAGSFSPFDFEKEFHMRHGMNPEDADKPWCEYYQPQGMLRRTRIPDEERRSVDNESSH